MIRYLYPSNMLPPGFRYPASFVDLVSRAEIPTVSSWWFLCANQELADSWLRIVREWYPTRSLVPFAKDSASDDIACFDGSDLSDDPIVHWVHTFCEAPYEDRGSVKNFDAWIEEAQAFGEL